MVSGTPVSVSAVGSGNASGSTRRKGEGSSLAADSGSKAGVFNRVASKKVHGSSNDRQRSTMAGHVSSSPPAYAFITHSQEGLRNNMPPMIDNAELARRRRRRTSQHDQAILEEEYRKCDRPDKARRREIAAMVEMGDKEVQIWFQNKRQSARRKLKPLLPHELIPAMKSSSSPLQTQYGHKNERAEHSGVSRAAVEEVDDLSTQKEKDISTGEAGAGIQIEALAYGNLNYGEGQARSSCRRQDAGHRCTHAVDHQDYGSSQDSGISCSHSSSLHFPKDTPSRQKDDGQSPHHEWDIDTPKLAPATVRRMSMSHMRLQEALSSPLRPPGSTTRAPAPPQTPQSKKQRRCFTAEGLSNKLSEYMHSDSPQQQTPINPLPTPSMTLPTPQASNPRRSNPHDAYRAPTLQKRSSSFIRLSTSLDGHAEVVIDTEPTLPPLLSHESPRPSSSASSELGSLEAWEFSSDKHHYLGSDNGVGSMSHNHYHHSVLEPDEAGTALSIARSRRRREILGEESRKFVSADAATRNSLRKDIGLGGMIAGTDLLPCHHSGAPQSDESFGNSKVVSTTSAEIGKKKKKKFSLGEVDAAGRMPIKELTGSTSHVSNNPNSRKRAYCEIEVYEQPQLHSSLPKSTTGSHQQVSGKPSTTSSRVKRKLLHESSSPVRREGGEDFYIVGNESDKENFGEKVEGGGQRVEAASVNGGKPTMVKNKKKQVKGRDGRRGLLGRRSKAEINRIPKTGKGCSSSSGSSSRSGGGGGCERRVKKSRRAVLGEVSGEKQPPAEMQKETELDLGGAELLLSLSAGRWG